MILLILSSCNNHRRFAPISFDKSPIPVPPDYSQYEYWAAHPDIADNADLLPSGIIENQQNNKKIDVFFIHPTTFLRKSKAWNFSFDDEETRTWTESGPIKHQASVFNGSCRVYAPFYRQAHIKSYFRPDNGGYQALDLAYQDVKKAFEHYLAFENQGRPFIIASHSQGTNHGIRLIKEFIDGKELQNQLIAAYLVGMPVKQNEFTSIQPCKTAIQTSCFCSWMTYANNYKPSFYKDDWQNNHVSNPVDFDHNYASWSPDSSHLGILMPSFEIKYKKTISASSSEGMLLIRKPKVWFRIFIQRKNWHKADYNLFWMNIRENVKLRVSAFMTE